MLYALKGKQSLATVSWEYLALPFALILLAYTLLPVSTLSVVVISAAFIVWGGVTSVALWRCAFNSSFLWLGYVARATIAPGLVVVIAFVVVLVIGIQSV